MDAFAGNFSALENEQDQPRQNPWEGLRQRLKWTDVLTYSYLLLGVVVMFGPVVWLIMSSFKSEAALIDDDVTFLPYQQIQVEVEGYEQPLNLFDVTLNRISINGAEVLVESVRASNGAIHVLDRVLLTTELEAALEALPATTEASFPTPLNATPLEGEGDLIQTTAATPETTIAAQLLTAATLELDPETDYTLLAPSDAAFAAFAERFGAERVNALMLPENQGLLRDLLAYHLLGVRYVGGRLYQQVGLDVPTLLEGQTLAFSLDPIETRQLAQVGAPSGAQYTFVDPNNPEAGEIQVFAYSTPQGLSTEFEPVRRVFFSLENYEGGVEAFPFWTYLRNSVIVTVVATLITLLINSMAGFALSKYRFRGRDIFFVIIISTLMVPITVILIPAFAVVSRIGWTNSLWGVIIPGAATPTGVFLLRQYMLTIPDELLDSARIDGATEWRIYWQIILPLARPALAVLAIFSIMWRWNDFLWPLIVLNQTELFTLQVGLRAFQGALDTQWHYVLAMTVLTLLPITLVFAFLQRYITSGIATTGLKG